MKLNLLKSSALALTLTVGSLAQALEMTPGTYKVDNAHSRASFVVPHFVVSEVEGRFNEINGEFVIGKPFNKTTLTATIPVKSIDTAVAKRDEHLRSKDFFEADKYPEMKLVLKSITGKPEKFKMVAALTIKDVTKDVTFEGKYTGSVIDSWKAQRAAFQATATINRKDFHISYDDKVDAGPAVGDQIKIRLWTEGVLVPTEKSAEKK